MSNETSPGKKRKIEPQNDYVSDDDRVCVMASDEFDDAEEEAQSHVRILLSQKSTHRF